MNTPISHSATILNFYLQFYEGQADVYDATRDRLLIGRNTMLNLSAAHLRILREPSPHKRLVWIDIGGGTGTPLSHHHCQIFFLSSFQAITSSLWTNTSLSRPSMRSISSIFANPCFKSRANALPRRAGIMLPCFVKMLMSSRSLNGPMAATRREALALLRSATPCLWQITFDLCLELQLKICTS